MEQVSVTRFNMNPEMGKCSMAFEHEGRLIYLGEAPCMEFVTVGSGFHGDINEMCWMTESGESIEMTVAEKKEIIREIRKWCKSTKRPNKTVVRFYDTSKGVFRIKPKVWDKIVGFFAMLVLAVMLGFVIWAMSLK